MVSPIADEQSLFVDGLDCGEVEGFGAAPTTDPGEDLASPIRVHPDLNATGNGHERDAPKKERAQ